MFGNIPDSVHIAAPTRAPPTTAVSHIHSSEECGLLTCPPAPYLQPCPSPDLQSPLHIAFYIHVLSPIQWERRVAMPPLATYQEPLPVRAGRLPIGSQGRVVPRWTRNVPRSEAPLRRHQFSQLLHFSFARSRPHLRFVRITNSQSQFPLKVIGPQSQQGISVSLSVSRLRNHGNDLLCWSICSSRRKVFRSNLDFGSNFRQPEPLKIKLSRRGWFSFHESGLYAERVFTGLFYSEQAAQA